VKYKNSIELTQTLRTMPGFKKGKENDFLVLLVKGYEGSIKELNNRIKALTDLFKTLQEEFVQIAETRKQLFVTRNNNYSSNDI